MKKKMKLSHVMESYWDMLPNEIKEYIIQFKISQQNIDQDKKDQRMSYVTKYTCMDN